MSYNITAFSDSRSACPAVHYVLRPTRAPRNGAMTRSTQHLGKDGDQIEHPFSDASNRGFRVRADYSVVEV